MSQHKANGRAVQRQGVVKRVRRHGSVRSAGGRIARNLKPRTPQPDCFDEEEEEDADDRDALTDEESSNFYKLLEQEGASGEADGDGEDWPPHESVSAGLNKQARKEFLERLTREDQHGPFTRRWQWAVCEQRQDADVLAVLIYWTDPERAHRPDRRRGLLNPWTANSVAQLAERTGWTQGQVSKSLRRLRERKLIGWKNCKFAGKKTRHLWIEWRAVQKAWKDLRNDEQTSSNPDEEDDEVE